MPSKPSHNPCRAPVAFFRSARLLALASLLWLGSLPAPVSAQDDTLRYLSYNLLYYGLPYSFCNQANNNLTLKDQYLQTILTHAQADVIAVCELLPGLPNAQRLYDSVISLVPGRTYAKAAITNFSNGDLTNMIFYDTEKLGFVSQDAVITEVRDINLYRFFLRTPDLGTGSDTLFFTSVIAHLKAGSGTSDEAKRASMVLTLMNYMNAQNLGGNLIISGDFNLYRSSEQAYQTLTTYANPSVRFYDPIDSPGNWSSNSLFAHVHTQSTHSGSNGCAASGGMDDRFDFILVSDALMTGNRGMQCIPSTYRALGQDGLHYNSSINAAPNNISVPGPVLEALYGMSDHLPVLLDIKTAKPMAIAGHGLNPFQISLNNPARDQAVCTIGKPTSSLKVEAFDLLTRQVKVLHETKQEANRLIFDISTYKPGLYLLRFSDASGKSHTEKLVVY